MISLVTLPLMFIATRWFSGQARKAFRQAPPEIGTVNADLQESISAVREVQAFSREDENIEQFRVSNAANRDANIKAQAYTSALAPDAGSAGLCQSGHRRRRRRPDAAAAAARCWARRSRWA